MNGTALREGPALDDLCCLELSHAGVARELAIDEALLIEADAGRGRPLLRFWEPTGYAVVLGASCRMGEDVHVDACREDGVPIWRRSSGGGTVVVGPGALSVTVILPESAAPGLSAVDQAQHHVLDWIARSIRHAGPPVTLAGRGDLVLFDRKCGGSAQRRLKDWFMIHCSILYDFPLARITRYLMIPRRQPDYRQGREHHDFLSNLGLPRTILMETIRGACLSGASRFQALPSAPLALVESLMAEKFANRTWIERL